MKKIGLLFLFVILVIPTFCGKSVEDKLLPPQVTIRLEDYLSSKVGEQTYITGVQVETASLYKKTVRILAGTPLSYRTYRKEDVEEIYKKVRELLPEEMQKYAIEIYSDGYKIEDYIPFDRKERIRNKVDKPLVVNLSNPVSAEKGLKNRHIALWQSHGWYYEQKLARWEWQRARIFQTVEDLYTQSYVLPFLVPMLENAGANVLLPRERDTQKHELIIDNDKSSSGSVYREKEGKDVWKEGIRKGFAHLKDLYVDGENPFEAGTFREIRTISKGEESVCEWIPDIPERGHYAVYVSYRTLPGSTDDARYTVSHLGGETSFSVNQQKGGGTWIYLGHFLFDEGQQETGKIVLTNKSNRNGKILTADAVKIGGGMGNIARMPHIDPEKPGVDINYQPEISGYPRYTEAARYWLQWAGMPDSIYNRSESQNDYMDDYQSRGFWVNHLAGGSSVLPKREGLNIPIDLSFAFHTDAGTTMNDSIVGTLGICMTHVNDEKFENGTYRLASRDLNDFVMTEIVGDIRREFEPEWTQRAIWNRSYSEARTPEVPAMLLELLSHQNLADMQYGLDPRFRFTVSRSIYKCMLKFLAQRYHQEYVVQPLPVGDFYLQMKSETSVLLFWEGVLDPSEPTATPKAYKVYTRIEEGDFDNGRLVQESQVELPVEKDRMYSFKVTAVNEGGESFPSEILSVSKQSQEKGLILVVNGFTRLAAPHSFASTDSLGGFLDFIDHGVPYKDEYHYTGSQFEFRREKPWTDDDAPGFGASYATHETQVIAGNTFDYPFIHGQAIVANGYSFISCSRESFSSGKLNLNEYPAIDLILGKQKKTIVGRGVFPAEFEAFTLDMRSLLTAYCRQGGSLFVSGAFICTDLCEEEKEEEVSFANDILKILWRTDRAAVEGKVKSVASPYPVFAGDYAYFNQLNSECYAVESPDAIEPVDKSVYTIFRYSENNLSAGVAYRGDYRSCVLGFPFETVKEKKQKDHLMGSVLSFLLEKYFYG